MHAPLTESSPAGRPLGPSSLDPGSLGRFGMKPTSAMVMRPAKATSNAARAAAVAASMLRSSAEQLKPASEDEASDEDNPNRSILTAEGAKRAKEKSQAERVREKAAEAEAARKASPVSKAAQRKLAQLEAKKQKEAARKEVMAVLAAHRLDEREASLLKGSGTHVAVP